MRYGQLVMGPAGSGKSHYCHTLQVAAAVGKRTIHVVNLDPAAEHFDYHPLVDIRDLIQLDDVMEDPDLKFGPNGGLVFCMEFLLENLDWLEEKLQQIEDDYILFDCPGQIELYTHLPVMRTLVDRLTGAWDFRLCGVFLVDCHFMVDGAKFISGSTTALSVMVNLEIPHVNVLSKVDLLNPAAKKKLDSYLHPDTRELLREVKSGTAFERKYARMTEALGRVLDDYSLVKFFPLDVSKEENVSDLLMVIDNTLQYGESLDVRTESLEDLRDPDDNDIPP